MPTPGETPPPPPKPAEIAALKRLVAGIIRAQGNRFIKELLRDRGLPIGTNKTDFETNLNAAIEAGKLRLDDVDGWHKLVEGWGNQHVYLYNLPPALRRELTEPTIRARVAQNEELKKVWEGKTVLEFPEMPSLTSVSFADSVLRLVWQEFSPGWTPVPEKNYTQEEGLDTFEYRAWRKIERRAITRFEAHLDKKLAALFIPNPIEGKEHKVALAEAKRVIALLLNLAVLESAQVDVSVVSKTLDQGNVPGNARQTPEVKTQRSRLAAGGAYVEFAADSSEKAYWEEAPIRDVRKSVRARQLPDFEGTEGVFLFQPTAGPSGLSRALRVQLHGKGDRIRLWAQMDANEVWTILTKLSEYQ